MSLTDDLRRGMVIRHEGQLFTVLDFRVAHTGKQRPTVHVKLRSVNTGHTGERTLDELGKIDEVDAQVRHLQYLYAAGRERVFMDTESFEQYPLGEDFLGSHIELLTEEETYPFQFIEEKAVAIQMPPAVVLEVVDTAPVQHAGGNTNVHKEAKLSSGIEVSVPLFIKNGDKIRIKTETREYLGKDH